jgi:hypothetical protein
MDCRGDRRGYAYEILCLVTTNSLNPATVQLAETLKALQIYDNTLDAFA